MTYNDQQFAELTQWAEGFEQAQHGYVHLPNLNGAALARIAEIHREATGSRLKANSRCAQCVLRVMRLVGAHYIVDRDDRELLARRAQAAAVTHEVATEDKSVKPKRKAVKTAKKAAK